MKELVQEGFLLIMLNAREQSKDYLTAITQELEFTHVTAATFLMLQLDV